MSDKKITNNETNLNNKDSKGSPKSTNKVFTDGERSTTWGIEPTDIEELEKAGIPYIFNPNNSKAVVLFDGRRRVSSVNKIFNCKKLPSIIRSKNGIFPFLECDEDMHLSFQFGFGLDFKRISSEYSDSVEIARIIVEFNFNSLKSLNNYLLKERPDLYKELVTHHNYYKQFLKDFESVDRLKEINDTIRDGFNMISDPNRYTYSYTDDEETGYKSVW